MLAGGLLAMAGLLLNKGSLAAEDALSKTDTALTASCLLAGSIASYLCLGRPYVEIDKDLLIVRNPLRRVVVPLSAVQEFTVGLLGFPSVSTAGRRVRLWGLEESVAQKMAGGSLDHAILRAELSRFQEQAPGPSAAVNWAVFSVGLAVLLTLWCTYAVTFLL
jgi:hypothetical protein